MHNISDTAFRFVSNNHRYIKQDGSGFFSGRLKSIFERAAFNVPLFVGACVGIGSMLLSDGNSGWESFLTNFLPFAIVSTLYGAIDQFPILKISNGSYEILKSQKGKAIDTTGTELSRANLSLDDLLTLKLKPIICATSVTLSCIVGECAFRLITGNSFVGGEFGQAIMACWAGDSLSSSYVAHKLYKGHTGEKNGYVFCNEVPKQPQKVKQSASGKIMGGLKTPSV